MYTVFLDGYEWRTGLTQQQASALVELYDGDKDCWYDEDDEPSDD